MYGVLNEINDDDDDDVMWKILMFEISVKKVYVTSF